ncbi:hypothetical protein K488DRAFT_92835, partial [Vararia minispora EC-137]
MRGQSSTAHLAFGKYPSCGVLAGFSSPSRVFSPSPPIDCRRLVSGEYPSQAGVIRLPTPRTPLTPWLGRESFAIPLARHIGHASRSRAILLVARSSVLVAPPPHSDSVSPASRPTCSVALRPVILLIRRLTPLTCCAGVPFLVRASRSPSRSPALRSIIFLVPRLAPVACRSGVPFFVRASRSPARPPSAPSSGRLQFGRIDLRSPALRPTVLLIPRLAPSRLPFGRPARSSSSGCPPRPSSRSPAVQAYCFPPLPPVPPPCLSRHRDPAVF